MDTSHGIDALKNSKLYNSIVTHREKFNALRGLDYANHVPNKINITPPESVIKEYEMDYSEMTKFMIYGEFLKFEKLITRIIELQTRINNLEN